MISQQFVELFDEEIPPLGIDLSHPLDMTQEKALGDKTRQSRLVDWRRMLIHCTADLDQRIDQRLWRNDIAQTQSGTKNLAHRSRINHSTGVIDPLQRRERWPRETELRVVIVFENKRVVRTRKIEQSGSARERHRISKRKLMRRCDVNDPGQRSFRRSPKHDPLVVARLGHYL